jgi:farnesyl diphosphate synthase
MPLQEQLTQAQQRINQLLAEQIKPLGQHAPDLKAAMEYALLIGGKRMRPLLVYATGEMLGVQKSDLDVAALALECIHAYSLVHDDLPAMDDDELRRGHPTCHIAFNEAIAILAGDALQTLAFDILANGVLSDEAEGVRLELIRTLSFASGYQGMCGGQAMDLAATDKVISQAQLESLHLKKTGALLLAAVKMACQLASDLSASSAQALEEYAQNIGLAFQVQDDILDVVGDSQTLGKPQGSDQAHNKSTYPAMLGLQGARDYLQELHNRALQALLTLPYNTRVLQSLADYIIQRNH